MTRTTTYLDNALSQVTDRSDTRYALLDALDQQWIDLNIITDIGVHENTIMQVSRGETQGTQRRTAVGTSQPPKERERDRRARRQTDRQTVSK